MEKEAMKGGALSKTLSDTILPHILNLYASRATPQDFEIYAPHATFEDPLMQAQGNNALSHVHGTQASRSGRDCAGNFVLVRGSCQSSTQFNERLSMGRRIGYTARMFKMKGESKACWKEALLHYIELQNQRKWIHKVKEIKSAFYSLAKIFRESKIVDYNIEENDISPGRTEILIDNKQFFKFCGKDINVVSLIKLYTEDGKIVRHEDWWDKKPLSNKETSPFFGRINDFRKRASMFITHAFMGFGKDPTV